MKSTGLTLGYRRDLDGSTRLQEEAGRSVQGLAARKVTGVVGLATRGSKSVEMETRLDAGVVRTGVESSGVVVDVLYSTGEDAAIAEQGPAGCDGDDAVGTELGISDLPFVAQYNINSWGVCVT